MDKLKKDITKAAGLTVATAGAVLASSYGVTKYFLKLAMDRTLPKSGEKAEKRISGKADNNDFLTELNRTSDLLENSCSKKIEIVADDGIKLVGHWIPSQNPERIIIAMHGWRSSWHKDFGMVSGAWKDNNCSVLYVEQRGQNNSEGDYIGLGMKERFDCVNWINWVIENKGTDLPIYLAGVSMGATTVMLASELDLPSSVHGIIADCGFTSPDAIWKYITVNNLHLAYKLKRKIANKIFQKKTKELSDRYSTEDALRKTNIPVLFIHGTDDHFVPVTMTYDNYKACKGPKHLLIVPGADHGMSYYMDKKEYEETVLDFWKKYDNYNRDSMTDIESHNEE